MADGGVGEAALLEEVVGATEVAGAAEAATAAAEAAAAASAASAAAGTAGAAGALGGTGIASLSPEVASTLLEYNPEIAQQLAQTQAAAGANTGLTQAMAQPSGIEALNPNTGFGQQPVNLGYNPQIGEGIQTVANTPTLPEGLAQNVPSPIGADYEQMPVAQQSGPFSGKEFQPRPGVTEANYGQDFNVGTPTSLGPEKSMLDQALDYAKANKLQTGSAALGLYSLANKPKVVGSQAPYSGPLSKYRLSDNYQPYVYKSYAEGGIAGGGAIEQMSNANAIGKNTGYPMADIQQGAYATPWQTPISRNMVSDSADTGVNQITGEAQLAKGGITDLGSYSDGGRMLKGPGDGMSDSIPANIGGKQPARLADGEFVVPADVVSHLGNGSTDAGAKQLYKMMDKVRSARTGNKRQGKQINPDKFTPA